MTDLTVVIPTLNLGGAERVTINLLEGFLQRDLTVKLICFDASGPLRAEIPGAVEIVDLRNARARFAAPKLVVYLLRNRPRKVLSALEHANIASLIAKLFLGARMTLGIAVHTDLRKLAGEPHIHYRILAFICSVLYRRADLVFSISTGVSASIEKVGRVPSAKIREVPNPVLGPNFPMETGGVSDRRSTEILCVARLAPEKDHETLIWAFAIAARKMPTLTLSIVGDGPCRRRMEELCAELGICDKVTFYGAVSDPTPHMKRASVLALTSRREGVPNVIVEAHALGLKVVATNASQGVAALLGDGKFGWLCPLGNAEVFAATLVEAVDACRPSIPPEFLEPFRYQRAADCYLAEFGLVDGSPKCV